MFGSYVCLYLLIIPTLPVRATARNTGARKILTPTFRVDKLLLGKEMFYTKNILKFSILAFDNYDVMLYMFVTLRVVT